MVKQFTRAIRKAAPAVLYRCFAANFAHELLSCILSTGPRRGIEYKPGESPKGQECPVKSFPGLKAGG